MNPPEGNVPGSKDKEDAMLVSMLDGKQLCRFQCRNSSSRQNHLGQKSAKFSLNMKNYCSIHLRLLQNLNEDRRHDIFTLNPEYHLKFLEENLNFLSRKPSKCSDFKISSTKSNFCSVETSSKLFSLSESRLPSLRFTSFSEDSVSEQKRIERHSDDTSSRDSVVYNGSKINMSSVSLQKQILEKSVISTPPIIKIKQKYSSKDGQSRELRLSQKYKPETTDKTTESVKNKSDVDTQFEFTVAGEKIVSFLCSPPASRRPRPKESELNHDCDSDEESTVSSSKGSSESASNASSKSSFSKYIKRKEAPPTRELIAKTHAAHANMLLWHPPSSSKNVVPRSEGKSIYSYSSFNQQFKQKPTESCINFFGSINSMSAITSGGERSWKNPQNQETVMFREAVLRGCYNIESILKEMKSPIPDLEKEVSQTREAIFSAVRLQRDNTSVISDSVGSVVDICNSWIKLNSHFERNDFKHFLELNGVDLTVIGDFAQWQCTSRILVDKLINVLKKVSVANQSNITGQSESVTVRGSELVTVHPNVALRNENTSNNIHCVVPNPNIPSITTDTQGGKRWKQRRFLSEKIDLEKAAITKNRPCKSNFTVTGTFQNPSLANNCSAEIAFGQGDGGLNFTSDFSKVNHLLSTKSYQSARSDISPLLNGSKQLDSSNLGYFDRNINESSLNYSKVETGINPLTPVNNLCTSVKNLVDTPLNSYFPSIIQVPTVPPLYNSQLCLMNANQYQPSFNHCVAKPNPIQCIDTDVSDNFIQSSYMKPGHYTPPQKPASFQKAVNNTIPIEDVLPIGIPFHYSAQCPSQQPKSIEFPNSLQIKTSRDNNQHLDTDDTWKTALSMVGPLRDTMMAEKTGEGPNLKLSETISLKSHFLLSDDNSQHSSSSGDYIKVNSESDELSFPSDPQKDIQIIKSKNKTTDWLIESFNNIGLGNGNSLGSDTSHADIGFENDPIEVSRSSEESNKVAENGSYPGYLTNSYNSLRNDQDDSIYSKSEGKLNSFLKNDTGYLQKKPRKNKKIRDDYTCFERKAALRYNKTFTRAMNNEITNQLEEILKCIWNTKVSTLMEEETQSEKEIAKLEVKVRSPLSLQAIQCKLSNHSYDTLDQALSELQQYFIDIRSKNKGDKQSIAVVDALEGVFFSLVEKHFGLTNQAPTKYMNHTSVGPANKARRTKKAPQRL